MWIRVETNVADNDKIHCFADTLGISVEEALGFLVRTWGKVAEHRTDGDLRGVLDSTIESWATWRGTKGQYATAFNQHFVNDCNITGWRDRQGKLIARLSVDRDRKRLGSSTEVPRKDNANSTPTKRNDTKRNNTAMYETEFDNDFWPSYPKRAGNNPRGKALTAYCARRREGVSAEELFSGVHRYLKFCETSGKVDTEWTLTAAVWLGPNTQGWTQEWTPAKKELTRDEEDEIAYEASRT